jgi:hypothetical protein
VVDSAGLAHNRQLVGGVRHLPRAHEHKITAPARGLGPADQRRPVLVSPP